MPTHVALLCGINLGARRRVAMGDLRAVATSAGLTDVATHGQSGNLLFTSPSTDVAALTSTLEELVEKELGVRSEVVLRTRDVFARAVADNPYPDEADPKALHVVFHRDPLTREAETAVVAAAERARAKGSRDDATVLGDLVYLHAPDGVGRSLLATELTRQPASAPRAVCTMRNWSTVTKVLALLDG